MEPFVHLHVHTEYSLLDGANRISDLVAAARADGHQALAITDHGNLFGAVEFYKACKEGGVQPILGCEVYVAADSMRKPHSRRENPYTHLTLLARDAAGWHNLLQLATGAHLEGYNFRPRVDLELLSRHAAGLTCLSGCMSGPVNRLLGRGEEEAALAAAGRLQDLFGADHFYLEVMRNGIQEQERLTEGMVRLRGRLRAPLIATNDIHYLRHEDCNAQDALLCIQTRSKRNDPSRWKMDTDTLFFRSRAQMNQIFADLPEALRNTLRVAEQSDLQLELGRFRLPRFDPPDGSSPEDLFRRLCEAGFARCYPGGPPAARERLEYEMKVIAEMGFISYFLIVWDLIRYARERGIPVGPGRGSAAGSVVAYALGITRLDPLRYDLLFERFLNASRISMPDIDIDFCKDRREEMLAYVRGRYGDDRVCQIITFGKLKAKAALRDVARVLDVPLAEADQVAKKVPDGPGVELARILEQDADIAAVASRSPLHAEWLDLAVKVEGLSRHSSVHAAGVVIADRPLREIVPLSRQENVVVTQWDMKACEDVGLLKMDFLGLRTLTILADAVRLVEQRHHVRLDLDALPLDDAPTYELLRNADTEGVFQLESGGMRRLLAELRPDCFEDVIAVLALFRPGPLGSGLHETYARRKHRQEQVSYPHPLLEEILRETYGVLIYQEQIMRVAQRMGGFTLVEADNLRKAMGKKKRDLMEKFERPFLDGAQRQAVAGDTARAIWDMMVKFAEYGFNKSHSAGYALVTFQTAFLKAHYPAEFYAATLTHEAADSDKLRAVVEDARKHKLEVLPPCVNRSDTRFTVRNDASVRFGLEAVKGVGAAAAARLVEIRQQAGQAFQTPLEVLVAGATAGFSKPFFESLIQAGAFDCFGKARVDLLGELEALLRYAQRQAEDRKRGQASLFDSGPAPPPPASAASPYYESQNEADTHKAPRLLSEEERMRTLALEKEALGLYLTRHPLDPYRDLLGGIAAWDSRTVAEAGDQRIVSLAGIASGVAIRPTRKDPSRKYARLRIEDLHGSTAAMVFSNTLEQHKEQVKDDFIGIFHGTLDLSGEDPVLLIDRIEPLAGRDEVHLNGSLLIRLPAGSPPLEALGAILKRHPGSATVRFLCQQADGSTTAIRAGSHWSVKLTGPLFQELEALLGPGAARAVADQRPAEAAPQPRWRSAASRPQPSAT
ncbi:MAG: DNA polymerase III subunit alpha [Planctomycetota bacterium]|nr:MAG: DNA polymerase III subunit alpha [Planctomycetota bacterium]